MPDIATLLRRGVTNAPALRDGLGVSPATMMRKLREEGTAVVRVGRGRATAYGLRHVWPSLSEARFPLFRVDGEGHAHGAGELATLAARQSAWLPDGHVFDGLPPQVFDTRPSGFLGKHFAAQHPDLPLPPRLSDWSNHHILLALTRRGEDLAGNLLVGDESFARWQRLEPPVASRDDYPRLAAETIAGRPPGSYSGVCSSAVMNRS